MPVGVKIEKLKRDSDLFFSRYEKMKKMQGTVREDQAIRILNCSPQTFHKWRKRLRVIQFQGIYTPLYLRRDVEKIRIYRQFGTLIKTLRKL
ncbi:MAG TPA: hypothetical protein DC024_10570 [Clostridiales bacterium]|jgi:hypothetical protein|nr:hypothetical protein [Clostridiales bacterium]